MLYLKNDELREIEEILVLEGGQQVYNFHVEEWLAMRLAKGGYWYIMRRAAEVFTTSARITNCAIIHFPRQRYIMRRKQRKQRLWLELIKRL